MKWNHRRNGRMNPMPDPNAPHRDINAPPSPPVKYASAYSDLLTGFAEGARQAASLKKRWQQPLAEWQQRELPCEDKAKQRLRLALGVAEEAGEVARCVLKGDQGIRGGADAWRDQLGGEIGDVVIYLIQLATASGLDFEECVEGAVCKVLARRFASAEREK